MREYEEFKWNVFEEILQQTIVFELKNGMHYLENIKNYDYDYIMM